MQTRSRDLGRNRAFGEQTFSGLPLAGPLLFPAPRGHLPPKFGLEGVSGPPRGPIVVFLLPSVLIPSVQFV